MLFFSFIRKGLFDKLKNSGSFFDNKWKARKSHHTSEKGEGTGDESSKRPRHVDMNQHLREILPDSEASYVHPKIPIPS